MAKKNSTVDDIIDTSNQGTSLSDVDFQGGIDLINRVDVATGKLRKGQRRKTIVSAAKKNLFEFPVFVSSSVPMNYAEATVSLIEQLYAAYLQMAISISPIVDAERVKAGQQFAGLKTDTNKYLEYVTDDSTDMWFAQEACHNEITTESADYTFDMLSIEDRDAKMILEYNRLDTPGDEFAHFFMEAKGNNGNNGQGNNGNNGNNGKNKGKKQNPTVDYTTLPQDEQNKINETIENNKKASEIKISAETERKESETAKKTKTKNENEVFEKTGKITDLKSFDTIKNDTVLTNADRDALYKYIKNMQEAKDAEAKGKAQSELFDFLNKNPDFKTACNGLKVTENDIKKLLDSCTTAQSFEVAENHISQIYSISKSVRALRENNVMIDGKPAYELIFEAQGKAAQLDLQYAVDNAKAQNIYNMARADREKHMANVLKAMDDLQNPDITESQKKEAKATLAKYEYEFKSLTKQAELAERDVQSASDKLAAEAKKSQWATTDEFLKREDAIREEQLKQLQHANSLLTRGVNTTKDITNIASTLTDITTKVLSAKDKHEIHKHEMERIQLQNEELKKKLEHYDEDRAFDKKMKKQEVLSKSAIKAPEYIDDSKCQKLNTMKPLMMNVQIAVKNKDDTLQPINYVVGVKTHLRVVPSDVLPEVAQYPLQEMDKISRKVKWRAGELKFFKDIVFRIKEKKQTAADSKDPRRKWYRRLYELANMQGDAPAASVVQGQSIFKTFIKDKQGKSPIQNGMMPNCSILMSKNDVDNIKSQTKIDLLKGSTAKKFCGDLFLLSLVVIDTDSEQIKVLLPDMHNDYDVHSLMSVEKQMASLDTAGTKTKEMFKLLG